MATLSRKQREIRARENLLLSLAKDLLQADGLRALTMDKVAAASEYSKGTIYQHFSSKEDMLAALVIGTMQDRIQRFESAAAFSGKTRERLTAIGVAEELYVLNNETEFRLQMAIMQEFIRPSVKPERLDQLERLEFQCMGITSGIVRDAISQGDLTLPPGATPEGLTLLLWGAYTGTFNMVTCRHIPECPVLDSLPTDMDPVANLRNNIQLLLDGYGWTPLSRDWDYQATYHKVVREVFPESA